MVRKLAGAAALAVLLAACGTNSKDRTEGGAAAGAVAGAGVGALGGPVGALAGAAIGGGAGAITGATTSPSDVNLGKPVWKNPEVRTPLDDNKGRRSASSTRRSQAQTAQRSDDRNRAYMGGGQVGTGTPATGGTGSVSGPGTSGTGNVGATSGMTAPTAPAAGTGPATTGSSTTTPSGSSAPGAPVR